MKERLRQITNFSFGSTSAIITNISLIIGLGSTQVPKAGIIGGLLIIGVADNISDSLGIHIYKESELYCFRETFISTVLNFISRLIISLTFIFIVIVLPTQQAQLIAAIWGLLILSSISYLISTKNKQNALTETLKHIGIAVLVIIASKLAGNFIYSHFGKT